jgi:hypothetical protein
MIQATVQEMNRCVARIIAGLLVAGVLLHAAADTAAAQRRSHTVGNFEYAVDAQDMYNTSSQPEFSFTGTWPQDYYRYGTISFHWNATLIGRYTTADGQEILRHDETWPSNAGYREPPEYGLREVRKVRPPVTYLQKADGSLAEVTRQSEVEVDPDIPSDVMIELKYKTPPGLDVTKRSYSFANQNHADYIVQHNQYVVTFDGDQDPGPDLGMDTTQVLEDVYFVIAYAFANVAGVNMNQTRWYSESVGEWGTYEMFSPSLEPSGRELLIAYGYDGQHPDINVYESGGRPFDNIGDPRHAIGIMPSTSYLPTAEFTSSTYAGYTTLHADESGTSTVDDPTQPRTVLTNANITNVWERRFEGYATWWDWAASHSRASAAEAPGFPNDPSQRPGSMMYKAYGPYDLVMGDTVNIVFAVGAGGISRAVAEEKGKEWLAWYRGEPGATFDDAAKDALIATGLDSLRQTLDRANWAWHNGLDVGNPLPSPDLTIIEGANRISLEWTDMASRNDNVDSYRIYRKRGTLQNDTDEELEAIIRERSDGTLWPGGTRRKWEMIAEVPATEVSYVDTDVIRGEPYYYGVTVLDDGSTDQGFASGRLESSRYTNRSNTPAFSFQPGVGATDNIRVVPNPFFASAGDYNFSDETNKLLFVNLPPYATIRIFTATGNLVKTIEHTNGSADATWDQVTDYNQLAASGVYLMLVTDAKDENGNPLPEALSKFVLVR